MVAEPILVTSVSQKSAWLSGQIAEPKMNDQDVGRWRDSEFVEVTDCTVFTTSCGDGKSLCARLPACRFNEGDFDFRLVSKMGLR